MKTLLALVTAAVVGISFVEDGRQESEPRWLDDFDEAVELAAETDRPLLLVFR